MKVIEVPASKDSGVSGGAGSMGKLVPGDGGVGVGWGRRARKLMSL